jgi:hypothetical protein
MANRMQERLDIWQASTAALRRAELELSGLKATSAIGVGRRTKRTRETLSPRPQAKIYSQALTSGRKDGLLDLPNIGVAFLDVIPAMRNKFHTTDELATSPVPARNLREESNAAG